PARPPRHGSITVRRAAPGRGPDSSPGSGPGGLERSELTSPFVAAMAKRRSPTEGGGIIVHRVGEPGRDRPRHLATDLGSIGPMRIPPAPALLESRFGGSRP